MLRYLTPILRGKYLDEITRADIVRIGEERRHNATPARANRYLALIRSILNRAMKVWDWLDKVPAITLYKEPKRRIRYLEPVEVRALMAELPDHLKPVVAFALLTGLRRSNISNLRWSQINLNRGLIVIDGEQMKNGNTHSVQLSEMAKAIVMQQMGNHPEYVFTFRGNPIGDFHKAFNAALKRTGITDFRFHDLRHTWASLLVQSGVSLYELQEMGAWQSEAMVKRYAHLSNSKLRENANVIASALDTALPFGDTNTTHIVLQ